MDPGEGAAGGASLVTTERGRAGAFVGATIEGIPAGAVLDALEYPEVLDCGAAGCTVGLGAWMASPSYTTWYPAEQHESHVVWEHRPASQLLEQTEQLSMVQHSAGAEQQFDEWPQVAQPSADATIDSKMVERKIRIGESFRVRSTHGPCASRWW